MLEYHDVGGQYANIRFDAGGTINTTSNHESVWARYIFAAGFVGLTVSKCFQNDQRFKPSCC